MLRVVLESGGEELDRFRRVVVAGVELAEHRQQERPSGAGLGALELLGVQGTQCVCIAELMQQSFEAVARRSVAGVGGDGGLIALARPFELVEALLHDPPRPEVGHRHLFGGQPRPARVGDLELDQLQQLRPHPVGVEETARVFDGGHVPGHHPKGSAHGGQAVDRAIEAEQRQTTDAIEQLGPGCGVLGLADRLELTEARLHRDLPATRCRRQLLEAAPQAGVVGLGRRGSTQQLEGGAALLVLAQRDARPRQRHRSTFGRARFGLGLERLQHQLGITGDLGHAE